ncbi:TetR/AcrR family transcriptional regulator [Oceanobacillus halotolerans]|uniref:TetR/AcrR family transcriptional regulator n=1 Tax=Oceanobacillus halotolerans TaxID=2663380 RepID=UPI0013D98AAF|nr:TetR/AcrR family transcriptional regulator [Oceanobacillus halotolerans]
MSTNVSNCKDRRVLRTQKQLKDALLILMEQKPFQAISISEIVQQADVNRGTFYNHYQYKEELLEAMIDDVLEDLVNAYRQPYQNIDRFDISTLSTSAIKIFDHVQSHATFYSLMLTSPDLQELQNKLGDVIKNLLLQDLLINNHQSNLKSEFLASYHAHALLGLIIEWVQGGFRYSSKFMTEKLLEIIQGKNSRKVFKTSIT